MTPSTITSIALAFALGITAMVAALHYHKAKRLRADNRSLSKKNYRSKISDNCHDALYIVTRIEPSKYVDNEIWFNWAVARQTITDGFMRRVLIKAFTDVDDDFNRRQAEELAEKLNEK